MRFYFSILSCVCVSFCFSACGSPQKSTPTAALNNYLQAANKKDVAAMKRSLSTGTIKINEEAAHALNITLDEAILRDSQNALTAKPSNPETRSEHITGATATLELKNAATGGWDKLYFVEENDEWKLAKDKMMQEMMKDAEPTIK